MLIIFTVGSREMHPRQRHESSDQPNSQLSYPDVYFRDALASHLTPAAGEVSVIGFLASDDGYRDAHRAPSYAVAAPGLRSGTQRRAAAAVARCRCGGGGDGGHRRRTDGRTRNGSSYAGDKL